MAKRTNEQGGTSVRAADLFAAALQHHQAGRLAEAEPLYRQVLALDPRHIDSLHNLGLLAYQLGRNEVAADFIGRAIALNDRQPVLHANLGMALQALGRPEEAAAAYRRAIALAPNHAAAHNNLGNTLKAGGRFEEAVASYARAVAIQPDYAEAHYNLGLALQHRGRLDEAAACYGRALAAKPDYAEAHNNLGIVLLHRGRLEAAVDAHGRAVAIQPDFAEAHYNLGLALQAQGRLAEAAAAFRRALALRPDHADAHTNLGVCLQFQGAPGEAAASFGRAAALKPDNADALDNLGNVLVEQGKLAEAAAAYDAALAIDPARASTRSNRLLRLNYDAGLSNEALLAEHRGWDERHGGGAARSAHANGRDPDRRLRIGYVSGDFQTHPVFYFLDAVLGAHDRSAVEIVCYAGGAIDDAATAELRAKADGWRNLVGVSDADAAAMIRQDRIDILVDLSGHTAKNRLPLFARKPAPVQATWLGYPNTTGLAAMDYRLVDPVTDPPGEADAWASEKLVRLEGGFLCYAPPPDAPPVAAPPSLAGGAVTFGSFNNPSKLSDPTVAAWAEILARTPGSRLLLKGRPFADEGVRARMQARFAERGIDPGRLTLTAWIAATQSHLAAYERIDIGLDPFPYNGTTTTCEALWMGVPVIVLLGERHAARVGASLLTHVGLPELIAPNEAAYVEAAVALAGDPARLAALRQDLRPRMAASPLCDGPRFARTLEAAYRAMWRRWCAGEPAAAFEIPAMR